MTSSDKRSDAVASARYRVMHDTHYRYAAPVSLAQQLAHLWPRKSPWQRCLSRQLTISPEPTRRRDEQDVFGNPLTRLAFERPHDQLGDAPGQGTARHDVANMVTILVYANVGHMRGDRVRRD